jgi:hypothetical protein
MTLDIEQTYAYWNVMTVYKDVNPILAAIIIYHEADYLYVKSINVLLNKLLI